MEIIGLVLAVGMLIAGFSGVSFWPSVGIAAIIGSALYAFVIRPVTVAGDIARVGAGKTAIFIIVTQFVTWAIFYGVGAIAGAAFS